MNKKALIVVGILVLLTGAVFVFTSDDTNDNIVNNENFQATEQVAVTEEEPNSEEQQVVASAENGLGYIEYSDQALADSSNSNRVLFFHAPWCSVCNFYEGQIEDQGVPSDVTILKIDYDSEDELKEAYNVTTQSTFVLLDENGSIENSWPFARGLSSIQDLYSQI